MPVPRWSFVVLSLAIATAALSACGADGDDSVAPTTASTTTTSTVPATTTSSAGSAPGAARPTTSGAPDSSAPAGSSTTTAPLDPLPGMPAPDPSNVYAFTGTGDMSPAVATARPLVYVPNNDDGTVTVIDQATRAVIDSFKVGKLPQHVVPSWDLKTLYANASGANQLVPIDPTTGKPGKPIPVEAPYNLYFTPDGKYALVMAERKQRIDYYDPTTWQLVRQVPVPCQGVNHADWTVDGRWFLVTCEFSGQLLQVDTESGTIMKVLPLQPGSMPQDVRLSPDGTVFFVADMMAGGCWIVDAHDPQVIGFLPTGVGAHGIYPSRDGTKLYISNRGRLAGDETRRSRPGDGSISVVDPTTRQVVATWSIPGGGSPDMGGVSADGTQLWLSGRYDREVYVFDTTSGALLARIPVGRGPHGLALFPQPGRYSLGHTGNYR